MSKDNVVNSEGTELNIDTQMINIDYGNLFKNNHIIMLLIDYSTMKIIDANPVACSFYSYSYKKSTACWRWWGEQISG